MPSSRGAALARMASMARMASSSAHMGSFAGVAGPSGKHVQPFDPARSSTSCPVSVAGQSMIRAAAATYSGAALIAFSIFHSGVPGAGGVGVPASRSPRPHAAADTSAAMATTSPALRTSTSWLTLAPAPAFATGARNDVSSRLMIRQLAADLAARRVSPVELVERAIEAAERTRSTLNAFITVDPEGALAGARRAAEDIARGRAAGPLAGIPVAHKDLVATKGLRTTAGSRILGGWIPRRDATLARRLAASGAVSIGKANTHEFAFGTTTDNPHYGAARNPWNAGLTTGGSSGGSAAAVAAGILPLATGTDTAGSIRIPAALCGVVGLKPTYGLVSTRGVVPLATTLDTAGPIGRTVDDVALGLEGLTGGKLEVAERADLRGVTVGVPEHYVFERVDPEIVAAVRGALAELEKLGAQVRAVEIPELAGCFDLGIAIVRPEALAFHSRWYPARAAEYGPDVARSLEMSRAISGADYLIALSRRRAFSRAVRRALEDVDLLAGPTVPMLAFENRLALEPVGPGGELPRFALTRLTYPFSLSRLPAISVPCGLSSGGLPIGLQLAAGAYEEELLLSVALAYERARGEFPEPPGRV